MVGEHLGIAFYTIGQRKRLPASNHGPLFVVALDADTNTVIVGTDAELFMPGFVADNCNWSAISSLEAEMERTGKPLARSGENPLQWTGRARHINARAGARHGRRRISTTPQRAVTPGQAAVFYGGEGEDAGQIVLGGGTIERADFTATGSGERLICAT